MMKYQPLLLLCSFVFLLSQCGQPSTKEDRSVPLFTLLPTDHTQIDFSNQLDYDADFNIFTYRNFYNGGGVGLGDFDKDGLVDVYFTGNMKPNRLYRNLGDFKFEDISVSAGVKGERAWSTGVSVADVNGDGWLDIYVCNSGDISGDNKQNELYINNGDLTFTEQAEAYGLADQGFSTHAAFFDYDRDGDLDLYLLNNSYQAIGSFNLRKNMRPVRDSVGGDKLYRNDGNIFLDVSEAAGIYGSVIGFGLGVTVGDLNRDGWQDIYVSNDFFERDYIYMNNQDGTFKENLVDQMRSISGASMGADMADINNDAYPDIFVTEMLPGDHQRLKTKTTFESWDRYQYNVKNGYYHQFTRNMLHLNNANGTFSEIGRLAGVEATDWSWGAMITDLDNDGYKDIFVANGIYQDLTDQDYIQFMSNEENRKSIITKSKVDFKRLIDSIPSEPISNYAFQNKGSAENAYRFENQAKAWGLDTPGFSNGSAYGDLDNDGDLDLIVNNTNMAAFVYRNETNTLRPHHFLKITLQGADKNSYGIGTKLEIRHRGQQFYLEQMPMRGFESTVDYRPNFGLGTLTQVDSLIVTWPDGRQQIKTQIATDQSLTFYQKEAKEIPATTTKTAATPIFKLVTNDRLFDYKHEENQFVDFDVDRLIYHMLSNEGPKVCKGDVNGDGREDIYVGGARDSAGKLFVQEANGAFRSISEALFAEDQISEDTDCLFFDADGDGDQDLYVASGGNEFSSNSSALKDRLYLNQGKEVFIKATYAAKYESTSCVDAADFDGDGDLDLFIGTRLLPRLYGIAANGYLLENDGKGSFKNVNKTKAPGLKNLGMLTDVVWFDHGKDGDADLMVIGEWSAIHFFENEGGTLVDKTADAGLSQSEGWWSCLEPGDFDNDGDIDFVVGNHGLNSRFRASATEPITLHINDFDQNGTVEQILSTYAEGKSYPMVLRHDLVMQLPQLKKKYLKYENYKDQQVTDIFTPEQLEKSRVKKVHHLASTLLINQGDGTFALQALPLEAQFAPLYGLLVEDFNKDGHLDLLTGGNLHRVKPEVGPYDASYGLLLLGDGKHNFKAVSAKASGLQIDGEVRDMLLLKNGKRSLVLIARNNDDFSILER